MLHARINSARESIIESMSTISVFNKFLFKEKEKVSLDIPKQINRKRYCLKTLILDYFPNNNDIPSPIQKFEMGIQKGYFEKTKDPKYLSQNNNPKRTVSQNHHNKIDIGSLAYLSLKEMEGRFSNRRVFNQKALLMLSNNFKIGKEFKGIPTLNMKRPGNHSKGKESNLTTITKTDNRSLNSSNLYSPLPKQNITFIKSEKKPRLFNMQQTYAITDYKTIEKPIKSNLPMKSFNTEENEITMSMTDGNVIPSSPNINVDKRKNWLSSKSSRKRLKTSRLKCKKHLFDEVDKLNMKRTHNEKILFQIIDHNTKKEEPLNEIVKRDLEELFDVHLKPKATSGETKKAIMQALQINSFRPVYIDETKNRMLQLSDRINKLTDDEALFYAERIAEEYYKNNLGLTDITEGKYTFLKKEGQQRNQNSKLKKLESNQTKMICLANSLIQKIRQKNRKYDSEKRNEIKPTKKKIIIIESKNSKDTKTV